MATADVNIQVNAQVTVPCFHPGCTAREHVLLPQDIQPITVTPGATAPSGTPSVADMVEQISTSLTGVGPTKI